jgi:nucleoside-diphosphate-sugar epimerase
MSATERRPAPVQVTRRGAIAVVGADGHVGRHLLAARRQDGADVRGVDRHDDLEEAVRGAHATAVGSDTALAQIVKLVQEAPRKAKLTVS